MSEDERLQLEDYNYFGSLWDEINGEENEDARNTTQSTARPESAEGQVQLVW